MSRNAPPEALAAGAAAFLEVLRRRDTSRTWRIVRPNERPEHNTPTTARKVVRPIATPEHMHTITDRQRAA